MQIDFTNNLVDQVLKIVAILFALFHFLVGFVMVSRITSMEKVLKTKNNLVFNLINLIYLGVLVFVLVLIILI